jgi:hypothetical protein
MIAITTSNSTNVNPELKSRRRLIERALNQRQAVSCTDDAGDDCSVFYWLPAEVVSYWDLTHPFSPGLMTLPHELVEKTSVGNEANQFEHC